MSGWCFDGSTGSAQAKIRMASVVLSLTKKGLRVGHLNASNPDVRFDWHR